MGRSGQGDWFDFAHELAEKGYTALTFNFRGFCPGGEQGCSQGEQDFSKMWKDIAGATRFLRAHGVGKVMLMGASLAAANSLLAAANETVDADGVVWLSGSDVSFPGDPTPIARRITVPKLFMVGRFDTPVLEPTRYMYELSPEPKELEILPTGEHGTDMLDEDYVGQSLARAARARLLSFLSKYS